MSTELHTQDAQTAPAADQPRYSLLVHLPAELGGARVLPLEDGGEVSVGRSRGATLTIDHDQVSRMHAAIRRAGDRVEVSDLGSRNGTRVNGIPVAPGTPLRAGDEVGIGPASLMLAVSSRATRRAAVADSDHGLRALTGEVDRATRYRRPLAVIMFRIEPEAALDHLAASLRTMDSLCEYGGDHYLAVLPELDRSQALVVTQRLTELARRHGAALHTGVATCPGNGSSAEALIGAAAAALRGEATTTPAPGDHAPVVLDPVMVRLYEVIGRVADSALTVLITGETGVGKELVAEALHRDSTRRAAPLVRLNCAALPENLLESKLFGHERGAFTGADRRKIGYVEAADGGSLFLDEIGEMPLPLQAKLLRVLEQKVVTRVGGTSEVAVDVRLIAATHRDLTGEVAAGRFREDLFFRITGVTLLVPPLRDRPSEMVPLAEHFIAAHGANPIVLTEPARDALRAYDWPGNIRELRNAIERALLLGGGGPIAAEDLPSRVLDGPQRPGAVGGPVRDRLAELERDAIVHALDVERNNQTRAARRLGLSRRALIYKMEKYGLKPAPMPRRADEPAT